MTEFLQVWPDHFRSMAELALHIRLAHFFWVGDVKTLAQLRKAHATMHETPTNPTAIHVHLPGEDFRVVEFGELFKGSGNG